MRGDKNMGVFETIFRKPKADLKAEGYFKMLNGYTPVFSGDTFGRVLRFKAETGDQRHGAKEP